MNCKTQGAVCPRKTLVAATLAALLCGAMAPISAQAEVLDIHKMSADGINGLIGDTDRKAAFSSDATYDGLNVDVTSPVRWNQLTLQVRSGSTLTINGDTTFRQFSNSVNHGNDIGNYGIYVGDSGSTLNLNGNVDIFMREGDGVEFSSTDHYIGTNGIYVYGTDSNETKVNVGKAGGTTRIWVIGDKPDAISIKGGSSGVAAVELVSTNNQMVGSVDMMGNILATDTFKATFSGSDAYWFGDEQDLNNSYSDTTKASNYFQTFDLTVENGAQYSYFGQTENFTRTVSFWGMTFTFKYDTIKKRLSGITLQNGGIINLKDDDLKAKYAEIGLDSYLPDEMASVDHDYIRIGKLNGTGGIFRLDLNPEDHTKSDMIFIEGSSDAGEHQLEISDVESLTSITEDNPLRFATVAKDAGITFTDKTIAPAESLYDYKVVIDSEDYSADDSRNAEYMDRIKADYSFYDASEFEGGTNWFISRVDKTVTPAADAIVDAGSASYDAIVSMDSYHDRTSELERDPSGLWVRYRHGGMGAKNHYTADYNAVSVGLDAAYMPDHSVGAAFTYTKSDAELETLEGKDKLKGYEGMLYTSYNDGTQYLDLVGRFGRVNSSLSGDSAISGKYHTTYGAISAEYGYKFRANENVFLEPEAQIQYARLGSSSYRNGRGITAKIDSADSVIGRIGARAGFEMDEDGLAVSGYFTANILHQFTDGQDARLSAGADSISRSWGDKGTWYNMGLAANIVANKKLGFQFAVSKDFGGDVDDAWFLQARMNYKF